jgi:hypothetical protein
MDGWMGGGCGGYEGWERVQASKQAIKHQEASG